jgi:putative oxidoreductase
MADFGLLFLRLTLGSLMAGHGAQKLFGWWKGPGLKGTQGFMENLGMKPGVVWGTLVAVGETSSLAWYGALWSRSARPPAAC